MPRFCMGWKYGLLWTRDEITLPMTAPAAIEVNASVCSFSAPRSKCGVLAAYTITADVTVWT